MVKRKRRKKWISWLIILILLVVAGVMVYLVWDNYFSDKKDGSEREGGNENSQIVGGENKKEGGELGGSKNEKTEEVEEKEKVVQYDGKDPNTADVLTGAITYAAVNGDRLMIRVSIDQFLNNGVCELNLIRGGVIYNDTVDIISAVSTATCEGFDVPLSNLNNGDYQIIVNLSSDTKMGTIEGKVNI